MHGEAPNNVCQLVTESARCLSSGHIQSAHIVSALLTNTNALQYKCIQKKLRKNTYAVYRIAYRASKGAPGTLRFSSTVHRRERPWSTQPVCCKKEKQAILHTWRGTRRSVPLGCLKLFFWPLGPACLQNLP